MGDTGKKPSLTGLDRPIDRIIGDLTDREKEMLKQRFTIPKSLPGKVEVEYRCKACGHANWYIIELPKRLRHCTACSHGMKFEKRPTIVETRRREVEK